MNKSTRDAVSKLFGVACAGVPYAEVVGGPDPSQPPLTDAEVAQIVKTAEIPGRVRLFEAGRNAVGFTVTYRSRLLFAAVTFDTAALREPAHAARPLLENECRWVAQLLDRDTAVLERNAETW